MLNLPHQFRLTHNSPTQYPKIATNSFDGIIDTKTIFTDLGGSYYEIYFRHPVNIHRIHVRGRIWDTLDFPAEVEFIGNDVSLATIALSITEDLQTFTNNNPQNMDVIKLRIMVNAYYEAPDPVDTDNNGGFIEIKIMGHETNVIEFDITEAAANKTITALDFMANAPFFHTGMYHGTLPGNANRTAFTDALAQAGIHGLRFPGGTSSKFYLIEGETETAVLRRDLIGVVGGGYNPDEWYNAYYVNFYDFLDFCQLNNIIPIYTVNDVFYHDTYTQTTHAIVKNKFIVQEDGTVLSAYYDPACNDFGENFAIEDDCIDFRIEKAAQDLGGHIDNIVNNGYAIKYWEIGNESFGHLDYSDNGLDIADNETVIYAKIAEAYTRVIKQKIPDAVIIIVGDKWTPEILDELSLLNIINDIDYISFHYPFGKWNVPPIDQKDDLGFLVSTDQFFSKNLKNKRDTLNTAGYPDMNISVTETMTWKIGTRNDGTPNWDSNLINPTFSRALQFAHNWGQLVFETESPINVVHDLETTFFGNNLYNVVLDPADKKLHWIGPNNQYQPDLITNPADIPASNWFRDSYFISSSGLVFNLLSKNIGKQVMDVSPQSPFQDITLFASRNADTITITIVNTSGSDKQVRATLSTITIDAQDALVEVIRSDNLAAILESEYIHETGSTIPIADNSDDLSQPVLDMTSAAYSVTQIVIGTTPPPVLSISLDSVSWNIGTMDSSTTATMTGTDKIIVTNDGTIPTTLSLHVAPSAGWTAASTENGADVDTFVMSGLIMSTAATVTETDFNTGTDDDVILPGSTKTAASEMFGNSLISIENGVGIAAGEQRALWLQFNAPTQTTVTTEQTLSITITAEVP